ncbi:cytidine deaminase [Thermincola ferriacetica]|uniref:Cytidine deaminase n=1 Tax=Thermincola ferriacetica TaxID=281456 RepID=A0A0L6VYN4_9FIRM|nr:cytidine deaminase [Thermincola ferriacetica]KNZ68336.1 cytidine deaminase [Thermincola ferriacetica]
MDKGVFERKKIDELVKHALEVKERAYAPYSKFRVGAALLTGDGRVYTGCNVENASFGLTICAERNAVFRAIADDCRDFKAIAIVSDADDYCIPCGACRQVLVEFSRDLTVIMANNKGDYRLTTITELLPEAFSGDSVTGGR